MQTQEEESFAAFASFLGTPLPANPIEALRILRLEAGKEIERLITFLDATGGDPDLEPTMGYVARGHVDEAEPEEDPEPSLGWTNAINQTSRNRLGDSNDQDYEKDDADAEDSDPGEDNGDFEPSLAGGGFTHPNGHDVDLEGDGNCDDEDSHDHEAAAAPSLKYVTALRARRGQPIGAMPKGFSNVGPLSDSDTLFIVGPDGRTEERNREGYRVVR